MAVKPVEPTPADVAVELKQAVAEHTAAEETLMTEGQRRINLIWEVTQSVIAITVTMTTLYVSAHMAINGQEEQSAFMLMSNVFFLVLGTYFNRTNHTRTGGVKEGDKGR